MSSTWTILAQERCENLWINGYNPLDLKYLGEEDLATRPEHSNYTSVAIRYVRFHKQAITFRSIRRLCEKFSSHDTSWG